jgi:hypothetical protein
MSLSRHFAASDGHSALGNNRRVIVRLCTNILPRSSARPFPLRPTQENAVRFPTVATTIPICLASLRAVGPEDMLVIQDSSVAYLRLPQSSWCTSFCRTGQIATIAFEAGLALVAHRARISLSSRLNLYPDWMRCCRLCIPVQC